MQLSEGLHTVADWMQRYQMTQPGDCVTVALSGGADSVCLLRLLLKLRERLQISVRAVHVNHCLRGEESERDAAFCRTLCGQLEVPLTLVRRDVSGYATREHCSLETAARICRYEAFSDLCREGGKLATAHTASDNLETAVHRLIRGGGLQGMSAIPPIRDFLIRPLLCLTRQQVEQLLFQLQQPFVTDSTNLTDDYTRNRIRHQILPQLRQLNPSVERTSVHTLSALRMENDFVTKQADQAYAACQTQPGCLTGLLDQHPAIRMRCLARLLREQNIPYDGKRLEQLEVLLHRDGTQELPGGFSARSVQGMLLLCREQRQDCPFPKSVPLHLGENRLYPGWNLRAWLLEDENCVKFRIVHKKFAKDCLDYDKIKGTVTLRGRVYGDRIQLAGCPFTSSIKKRIQEKVPKNRRKTLHFLEDREGLFYAEQIGIAQRVAPDDTTRRLLFLSAEPDAAPEPERME